VNVSGEPERFSLTVTRPGGRRLFGLRFTPLGVFLVCLALVALIAVEVLAVVSYIRTLDRLAAYSALMVEVNDLRRQNAKLLELDEELRDLLVYQQQMLRLAGIETALRRAPAVGDNTLGSGEPDSLGEGEAAGFLPPAMGRLIRGFGSDHGGVDLGLAQRRAVIAAGSGVVIESHLDPVWGFRIVIAHSDSVRTVYANNERNLVAVDDSVRAGEVIALVGSGFEGQEPHLHFEVWIHDEPVPPETVLPLLQNDAGGTAERRP
jgi:murein DD-endopeptidase MepM/ murein hydrolase activator NlpD